MKWIVDQLIWLVFWITVFLVGCVVAHGPIGGGVVLACAFLFCRPKK